MSLKLKNSHHLSAAGFTIVELLIVIVVIGILATITIVAYNGVTKDASNTVLQSDLKNIQSSLELELHDNGVYPSNDDNLPRSSGTTIEYSSNGYEFCVIAFSNIADNSYYLDSDSGAISEGECDPID